MITIEQLKIRIDAIAALYPDAKVFGYWDNKHFFLQAEPPQEVAIPFVSVPSSFHGGGEAE